MTRKQIQDQMSSVFETIGRLAEESKKTVESLKKLQEEEKKYAEGVNDSSEAYALIKRQDVVHLPTFRSAKNNKEDVLKLYEDLKVKVLISKAQLDILERDLAIYKDKYSKLEELYQNHDNTLRFCRDEQKQDKPN